jgi:hypothetical protein
VGSASPEYAFCVEPDKTFVKRAFTKTPKLFVMMPLVARLDHRRLTKSQARCRRLGAQNGGRCATRPRVVNTLRLFASTICTLHEDALDPSRHALMVPARPRFTLPFWVIVDLP